MIKHAFKALFLGGVLASQGCVVVETGTKISYTDWAALKVGKTTKMDVINKFGKPFTEAQEYNPGKGDWKLCGDEGAMIDSLVYHHSEVSAVVGPGFAKRKNNQQTYTLRFNKQGFLCMKAEQKV